MGFSGLFNKWSFYLLFLPATDRLQKQSQLSCIMVYIHDLSIYLFLWCHLTCSFISYVSYKWKLALETWCHSRSTCLVKSLCKWCSVLHKHHSIWFFLTSNDTEIDKDVTVWSLSGKFPLKPSFNGSIAWVSYFSRYHKMVILYLFIFYFNKLHFFDY